jgi:ankyrin repeat protein
MTPLHWAVEKGHREVAGILLKSGANPTSRNKLFLTVLDTAEEKGDDDLVNLLLVRPWTKCAVHDFPA